MTADDEDIYGAVAQYRKDHPETMTNEQHVKWGSTRFCFGLSGVLLILSGLSVTLMNIGWINTPQKGYFLGAAAMAVYLFLARWMARQ